MKIQILKSWSLLLWLIIANPSPIVAEWQRHTIDATSIGADGVRLKDINKDGLNDVVTAWEEGGLIRVYLHPGEKNVTEPWPKVTVGQVPSPEDAVLVDLDNDGHWDVLSSCEGRAKSLFVHWAPPEQDQFLLESSWSTQAIPAAEKKEAWMFALPLLDAASPVQSIVLGSKGNRASVSLARIPLNPRAMSSWKVDPLYRAGWIMSLRHFDFDADGDLDVLVSDRKGNTSGVLWLENPGGHSTGEMRPWREHRIGATGEEVMFLDIREDTTKKQLSIAAAVKPNQVLQFTADRTNPLQWQSSRLVIDALTGTAKAVKYADINLDGHLDLVASCEQANGSRIGVYWFAIQTSENRSVSNIHDISGPQGIKFDRIETIDLDGDGDLDVMTCEERDNLGVIWYENPTL